MEKYTGKAAYQGIAIGKIAEMKKADKVVRREHVNDVEAEVARYEAARDTAIGQLQDLYEKAVKDVGEEHAEIFNVHQMLLDDDDFNDSITEIIRMQGVNAEYAVATTGDNFSEMFANMEDEYFRGRAADIKDISERVVTVLLGGGAGANDFSEPIILVADDLAPSETVQLPKEMVMSFVTRQGSTNSHTAILARTMNIPALVQVPIPADVDGKFAIVDGMTSTVIIEPDEETLEKYKKLQEKEPEKKRLLMEMKGKDTVTKSGRHIKLYGNIGGVG
ncbi:MAG: phosphoenolpyruvate-utilizing N-terminal domain-containing protein, partial [Lachnospiraceae bacterium]